MYPMKMIPIFKNYIWGGERLVTELNKKTDLQPVAESWEISDHSDGKSIVANGKYKGMSLADVIRIDPLILGKIHLNKNSVPIIVKLIDAKQNLSLQVHPSDEYAWRVEGQPGKNEMWYVMDCNEGATLILGLKFPLSKEELKARITNSTILDVVNLVPVKKGDYFFIPAGMIHAIGGGCLIAEVQQNSNITYRIFDYGRKDTGGRLRALHIDKALDVANTSLRADDFVNISPVQTYNGYSAYPMVKYDFFQTILIDVESHMMLKQTNESFQCLLVIEGVLTLESEDCLLHILKGETIFIPAYFNNYKLSGCGKVILIKF